MKKSILKDKARWSNIERNTWSCLGCAKACLITSKIKPKGCIQKRK